MNPVRDYDMWYVYVLLSKTSHRWYTGMTQDLRKRFSGTKGTLGRENYFLNLAWASAISK